MVTFNENRHCVFPLVPADCDYAKLDEYFVKLRNAEITALRLHGDFGEYSEVSKVEKSKNRRLMGKWEIQKRVLRTWKTQFKALL